MEIITKADLTNTNKQKRIDELHSEKEQEYHTALDAATGSIENNTIVKRAIQKAALALEEIYHLYEQEWMLQEIGSIIIKDLKTRGFPDAKYRYVYEALEMYGDRFVRSLEDSSSQSVSGLSKRQELFYKTKSLEYYQSLKKLEDLINDYDFLPKRDIQTIVPKLLDIYDKNEKECLRRAILISKEKQDDFESGPDQYEDRIQINKDIPEVPESLEKEFNIWITKFLPSLLKKLTDYPIKDKTQEKRMTAGWAAIRHAHDPFTDDKYRKSYYDWIQIVTFADESFKHHAASHFKTQDFAGRWRKLTREQIGARQKSIPLWCKWFFETVPGFMEEIAWSREKRETRLSAFSIDLSPKLSEKSLR